MQGQIRLWGGVLTWVLLLPACMESVCPYLEGRWAVGPALWNDLPLAFSLQSLGVILTMDRVSERCF